MKSLADKLKNSHDFFLIGRDLAFPTALKGHLKSRKLATSMLKDLPVLN